MIVMPGFVDSHTHMWSTLGRNFTSDGGFSYYPAKWATAAVFTPDDFYNSLMLGFAELANGGVTTVHNWSHNNPSPDHADAELRAHQHSLMRGRYSLGHVDRMPPDVVNRYEDLDRIEREWFAGGGRFDGLVHLGVNLRGIVQSEARVFHEEMAFVMRRRLPVCIHATQTKPNLDDAADYERRGYLSPSFMFSYYLDASDSDRAAMARTGASLTFSPHSEFRFGEHGDPRVSLMKARAAGVLVTLSSDATSIAPPNVFELMRFAWNMCIPWKQTDTETLPPLGFAEAIELATINGAKALGLGGVAGSLTPGKRADVILVRTDEINIAPLANIETTIVQGGSPANVDTVLVDGRILKRHGKLVHLDIPAIVEQAERSALRIRTAAGGALKPVSDAPPAPIASGPLAQRLRQQRFADHRKRTSRFSHEAPAALTFRRCRQAMRSFYPSVRKPDGKLRRQRIAYGGSIPPIAVRKRLNMTRFRNSPRAASNSSIRGIGRPLLWPLRYASIKASTLPSL